MLAVVVVLLVGSTGWLAWRATQVVGALEGVVPEVGALRDDLASGDVEGAQARLPGLREAAATATTATADPVWRVALHVPWAGRQLAAVSEVAEAFDVLAQDALPALTRAGAGLDVAALRPVDGRVELAPLVEAAPHLREASVAAARADEIVGGIPTDDLVPPLARRVVEARAAVDDAAGTLATAASAAELVPAMLGVDGPRAYLVLVVSSAELRGGGGIVGALARVTADDGALTLTDHRAARDLPSFDAPVLPLGADEERVHTSRLGRFVQNVTMTPDFPRTAALASEFWVRATGEQVDGVLATDVTTLSYVLGATGPVEVDGLPLDADGVVRALLHEAYLEHPDPEHTDAYFARAAAAVFGALTGGEGDQGGLLPAVRRAVDERRVAVWSADPAEQARLGATGVGGGFLSGAADSAGGVFLDDATGSKIDYFLDVGLGARPAACVAPEAGASAVGEDGDVVVDLVLRSTVPLDTTGLPRDVVGHGIAVPAGTARTTVSFYAPVGGEVVEVRRGSAAIGGVTARREGRDVAVLTSELAPGEEEAYRVVLRPGGPEGVSELWATPTPGSAGRVPVAGCAGTSVDASQPSDG